MVKIYVAGIFLIGTVCVAAQGPKRADQSALSSRKGNLKFCPGSGLPCVEISPDAYKKGHEQFVQSCGFCHGPTAGGGSDGILTTAGHLLFTDESGQLVALDAGTGEVLWHVYAGGNLSGCPMTYEWEGRQYVLTPVDGVLYAWALPAKELQPSSSRGTH
jgi:outer membrane protein assembly factor BamB